MVSIELSNLMKLLAQDTKIYENCMALYDQLINKIRDLEEKFDTSDELDMAIEHTKSVDLVKLQEMETWDDSVDLPWFESHLNFLAESLRNEILVTASIMMERLFEDEKLISRYKFVSRTVLEASFCKQRKWWCGYYGHDFRKTRFCHQGSGTNRRRIRTICIRTKTTSGKLQHESWEKTPIV